MPASTTNNLDLWHVGRDGRLQIHLHAGQTKAWQSKRRFVTVCAGTQGGKTSFGPLWLLREIQEKGPGDYIVAAPTFPLLSLKLLPEFLRFFQEKGKFGVYTSNPKRFRFTDEGARRLFGYVPDVPTNVYFGHAMDPDSLESATAKGAWLDEAGQKKFKHGSWQAILRRLSLHMGRVLTTTTPYNAFGWFKTELHDRWKEGDPDYDWVRFESRMNPSFPPEEWERARRTLPKWKFDLMYRGMLTRPAGQIYDVWEEEWEVPRFTVPPDWKRYAGMDFGGVNTAVIFLAEQPNPRAPSESIFYLYREYKAGGRTAAEHIKYLLEGEPPNIYWTGGSGSEGQWRKEFRAGGLGIPGLPVREPPTSDVEIGIERVYGLMKTGRLRIFDDCEGVLEDVTTYSRKLDENDQPTEEIEDKAKFHFADALRYIGSHLNRGNVGVTSQAAAEKLYR